MSVFFILSRPENLEWLERSCDSYLGPGVDKDAGEGIPPDFLAFIANNYDDWVEIRQGPWGYVRANLTRMPVVAKIQLTGDREVDFDHFLHAWREANANAANVTFDDPPG